jgi:hypothetical protein
MPKKTHDLAIKTGEYESNGQTKGRYKHIGAVFEGDKGSYLLIDSTCLSMQLFALVNKDRRDSVLVSMFETKDDRKSTTAPRESADLDDTIPF